MVHPFIEAEMSKGHVRTLARDLGLGDIAELPAQPCLSSRVETGIAIDADDLAFVEMVESRLVPMAPPGATLRCRITRGGVVVEIGQEAALHKPEFEHVVGDLCVARGRRFVGVRTYERGSMFVGR